MKKHIIIPCAFLLTGIVYSLSAFAQQGEEQSPAQLVSIDSVKQEMITSRVWVPGTVMSITDSELSSEVNGRINWMANVGDRITAGEALVKLDGRRLNITRTQNKADIEKWKARVDLLQTRSNRFASMAALQNTSKDEFDTVKAELLIATQELTQAEANLAMTEYELMQTQVVAPFDVLVVERLQSPGEYVSTGQVLLRVVDPTRVEASVRAPLNVLPFVAEGMQVPIKDQSTEMVQSVRTIVPVGNARSRMMELRIALSPNDFAIGSAVRVGLPNSATHSGLTVPRDALVLRKSGTFIYQIDETEHAQQIAVTTGAGLGDRIEVMGKLITTNPVVIRGAERLSAGDKVRLAEDGELARL